MSDEDRNIEHQLDINEIFLLEILVRNEIDREIKDRPESITAPDGIDTGLHRLSEKLIRCYRGTLFEHPASDEIGRLVHDVIAPNAFLERLRR